MSTDEPLGMILAPDQIRARWELARQDVERALTQSLVVAFVGSASAGKDAAIRALFGLDFGQIDPIPGSTEEVRVAALDEQGRVLVVNAPGFGDLRAQVDQAARRVLEQLDLAVYVLNADGGATIDEKRDLDAIVALGRPVLVCVNKIDLIRPHEREAFVAATLTQLGVKPEDAVVTAFDPLPALALEPIGVEPVIAWIARHLEENGKELVFAKQLRNKAAACEILVQQAARRAAVAGAVPVPGADMAAITAVQVKLVSDLAEVFGSRMDRDLALFLLGEVLTGSSKGFVRWAVEALKTAGWIPGGQFAHIATSALGASIAGATTYGVGRAAIAFLQSGQTMSGAELRDVFDQEAFAWKERATPSKSS